jgi:hypothetical protein
VDALLSDEQNDLRLATASLAQDIGTETDSEFGEDGPQGQSLDPAGPERASRAAHAKRAGRTAGTSGVGVAVVTEQLTASLVAASFLGCAVLAAELARSAGAVDILTAIGSVDRKSP